MKSVYMKISEADAAALKEILMWHEMFCKEKKTLAAQRRITWDGARAWEDSLKANYKIGRSLSDAMQVLEETQG